MPTVLICILIGVTAGVLREIASPSTSGRSHYVKHAPQTTARPDFSSPPAPTQNDSSYRVQVTGNDHPDYTVDVYVTKRGHTH